MRADRWGKLLRVVFSAALIGLLGFGAVGRASAATIIYVKYNAIGANNGTSWTNAYKSLQKALSHAVSGQQIWVAKGRYTPTTGTDRTISFVLKNGVAVYGGFAGSETLLSQRKPSVNVTILSGDIAAVGNVNDNSYNVVSGGGTNATAILDGFKIVGGNANCGCFPGDAGGGIFNWNSSPTLRTLTISNNSTAGYGAGMYNNGSSPTLTNVTFHGNSAGSFGDGGGMYNNGGSSPKLNHVVFSGNSANRGGGMFNDGGSSPKLTSVTFNVNTAVSDGGGMYNGSGSNPTLANVIFSSNTATNGNGGGIFNTANSPTLTNVTFGGNQAGAGGGGIYDLSGGNPVLTDVTFSGNSSANGGGMDNYSGSNPTLRNVTFSSDSASSGGGMYNNGSSPSLTNVTFSGNTASLAGPAMDNESGSSPQIYDGIFWNDVSGEIWNGSPGSTFTDSIISGSCPGGSTCTNLSTADPVLGALQNNGGFTQTMALGAGSAALDAGGAISTCAAKDQRGVSRPQGGACDIGAYEVRAMSFLSQGSYDGQVLESAKGSNIGGSSVSTGNALRVGDNASDRRYRGFLCFDTAAIPDAAAAVFARLSVRQQTIPTGTPFSTEGSLVTDVAKPYFGSALSLVNSDFQASATVNSAGSFLSDSTWYNSVLNGPGRNAINKTGTTEFRLHFSLSDNNHQADYLSLYSGDATLGSNRPVLTVYYNP